MQFFIKKQHKTLTNDGGLNIIIRFGAIDAKWEAWAKEFFMFEYVTKAEYQPVREELERIINRVQKEMRTQFQKKFKEGEVVLACSQFLGYDHDKDKNIVINEEQAKVVRRIYREFLSGYACSAIAKRLTEDGIPTPSGKKQWRTGVIKSILTNEKYYGSAYLGKTCKRDVLSKERVASEEVYYVENSHPAIIPKNTWDLVQLEMTRRQEYRTCSETGNGKYSSKYPFSKKLICGECGMIYRRHAQYKRGNYVRTWVCITHKRKGNDYCSQRYILEDDVANAFQTVLKELVRTLTIKS